MSMLASTDANQAYWKFIQGFVLGQVLLCILLYLLFKYWFLDDATKRIYEPTAQSSISAKLKAEFDKKRGHNQNLKKNFTNHRSSLNLGDFEVLSKVQYSLHDQAPESCSWLNVLLAQLIFKYRNDLLMSSNFQQALEAGLNNPIKPSILGAVTLTDISFGNEFPILSEVVIEHRKDGPVHTQVLLDYNDKISLAFDSSLLVPLLGVTLAALPFSLSLSLVKFSGKLSLELDFEGPEPCIHWSIAPDYILDFEVGTLVGHRSKLKDMAKVADLITYKLKATFQANLVYPNRRSFILPKVDAILLNIIKKDPQAKHTDGTTQDVEINEESEPITVDKDKVVESVKEIIEQVKDA